MDETQARARRRASECVSSYSIESGRDGLRKDGVRSSADQRGNAGVRSAR
jgi:hypothetical protein